MGQEKPFSSEGTTVESLLQPGALEGLDVAALKRLAELGEKANLLLADRARVESTLVASKAPLIIAFEKGAKNSLADDLRFEQKFRDAIETLKKLDLYSLEDKRFSFDYAIKNISLEQLRSASNFAESSVIVNVGNFSVEDLIKAIQKRKDLPISIAIRNNPGLGVGRGAPRRGISFIGTQKKPNLSPRDDDSFPLEQRLKSFESYKEKMKLKGLTYHEYLLHIMQRIEVGALNEVSGEIIIDENYRSGNSTVSVACLPKRAEIDSKGGKDLNINLSIIEINALGRWPGSSFRPSVGLHWH